jgi:ribosomal protein L36
MQSILFLRNTIFVSFTDSEKYLFAHIHMGEEVLHEGWSSYDNLLRSSCDNCHGVRRKTIVYTLKHSSKMEIFIA